MQLANMEWDCRLSYYSCIAAFYSKLLLSCVVLILLLKNSSAVHFDCDKVNNANGCLCYKLDKGWHIECPNKQLETYPISLKGKSITRINSTYNSRYFWYNKMQYIRDEHTVTCEVTP